MNWTYLKCIVQIEKSKEWNVKKTEQPLIILFNINSSESATRSKKQCVFYSIDQTWK